MLHSAVLRPFFLLGALLFACSACSRRETTVEAGIRTQTLHVGNNAEPPDLDPQTNTSTVTSSILDSLFEGLVRLADDGTTIKPGVAEKWEISPDGLTYTFHLRMNAAWSNGEPVTADDFVAAFRRFLEPKLGCEGVNIVFPVVGARDFLEGRSQDFSSVGIQAPEARTVVIRLLFRAPYFLATLADSHLSPVHQPSLDKFKGRDQRGAKWTQPGNLVSNGPFLLQLWQPGALLVVVKNPRYWDADRVRLKEIDFYPIDDLSVEENTFRAGQLHVTFSLPYGKLGAYTERHAPELRSTPLLSSNFVTFSTRRPPFNDARVRRALSLAIDRERLATTVLKGRGTPAFAYTPTGTGGYSFPPFARFDPTEAKKLLAEAGFPGGKGFPTVEYTIASRGEDKLIVGQALQEMWRQTLGINVTLAPVELKVWLDLLRTKAFALTGDNWNMGINDPIDILALGVTGDPGNDAGWSNPRYDAAFRSINYAPDDTARREAIAACERLIAEEAPYAPIFFEIRAHLVHPSVVGWRDNAIQKIDWTTVSLAAPK